MTLIKVNQVQINYKEEGQGEAVVFLHGFTGSTRDWEGQFALLKDRYRLVAVDHRGHGGSEAPQAEEDYSIYLFCEDVHALLDRLNITKCCVVGHSMGGFMALQMALDYPELVRGLVLVDTSSGEFDTPPGYADLREELDRLARTEGLEAAFEYDATHNPTRIETFKRNPGLREMARKRVLGTSVDGYIYVHRAFGRWKPVTDRLHEIKIPTLIFWGEEDVPFERPCQTLKASIRDSVLLPVPGSGHNPHEEAPDVFNEGLLGYLAQLAW